MKPVLVVGGMNMDVLAMPDAEFILGDSLIGKIRLSPGGVGRNIAEQLARHFIPVELLTVLGQDSFAAELEKSCKSLGIGLKHAIQGPENSCVYLAVHDSQGDMTIAINDMAAITLIDAAAVEKVSGNLFGACLLDANLSEECLIAASRHLTMPLMADTVSCGKAKRLLPILSKLKGIKPNLLEARLMTGQDNAFDAASSLLDSGVEQVYISMGKEGLYCAGRHERYQFPAAALSHGPTTGAGDAMTAGILAAISQGKDLRESAENGIKFAGEHLARMAELYSGH